MTDLILNLLVPCSKDDAGQGLVEYVLIFGIVAFAASAGMGSLAKAINSTFTAVSTLFGRHIT
jgi:Flp pilus assembly pilin Flp